MDKYKCDCSFDYLQIEYYEITEISNYLNDITKKENKDFLIEGLYIKYPFLTKTDIHLPFSYESIIEDNNYVTPYSSRTENCTQCIDAGIYVSSLISFGYILLENDLNLQKIDILSNILNKLLFYKYKFNNNIIYIDFINRIWDICYADLKWAPLLAILCVEYPRKLHQIIDLIIKESTTMMSSLDLTLLKYNDHYINLIQFCSKIKQVFQNVIFYIRDKMIETKFPINNTLFLELFLKDIKNNVNITQFKNMYPDNLINYILILSSTENNTNSITILNMLKELKNNNYNEFILLITHFPYYKFLLNDECFV